MKYWVLVCLWITLISFLSSNAFSSEHTSIIIEPILRFIFPSVPVNTIHFIHRIIRKLAHLTEYFILGVLLFKASWHSFAVQRFKSSALLSLLLGTAVALADEYHQSFVPGRQSSIYDVGIDAVGIMFALTACILVARKNVVIR